MSVVAEYPQVCHSYFTLDRSIISYHAIMHSGTRDSTTDAQRFASTSKMQAIWCCKQLEKADR
jgi:hypothetical protein